ncbi:MAG: S8 family serine peptidase, partial [Lachnospiraceae bacterium]|nr:S8 family serine peptidase [Lachnospiraceae bacterium]
MRNRKVKRMLSGLLTIVMLAGQVPEVYAAGDADTGIDGVTDSVSVDDGTDVKAEDSMSENDLQEENEDPVLPEVTLDDMTAGIDYTEGKLIALPENETQAKELAAYYGGRLESFDYGVAVILLDDITVARALAMDKYEGIVVEPDYIYTTSREVQEDISGDEVYDDEGSSVPVEHGWGDWYVDPPYGDIYLNPQDENFQWMHDMVHSYAAWGVTTGNSDVTVGIVGSGIYDEHKDFADYDGSNKRAGGNVVGNFARTDISGEGTHSAGIIAAGLQNGQPAVGIAPGVKISGVRVADDDSNVTSERLVSAIKSLTTEKVDIILLDTLLEGRYGSVFSQNEQDAINAAVNSGITVIAGAGDEGSNAKSYPSAYDNVITVGAVNKDGSVAGFSNNGSVVDIYAPGVGIASTGIGNAYFKRSSTSVAASVVAGVAALYMSAYGHVKPSVMEEKLMNCKNSKGIVDAARIFNGDKNAPEVVINDSFGNIAYAQTGGQKETGLIIPGDAYITFNPKNYSGKEGNNGNAVVIYSFDGKAPSVKNGEVTHGEVFKDKIYLKDIYKTTTSKTKYTLIAAAVTSIGVMSKTTSVTFTVDPNAVSKELSLRISGVSEDPDNPTQIPLGYPIQFKYEASGIDTNTITWGCRNAKGITAKMDAKTGVLTTSGSSNGKVTIYCKATSPKEIEFAAELRVVGGKKPVGKITLNAKNIELKYSDDNPGTYNLKIEDYKDQDGWDVDPGLWSLEWSSSDESVAIVERLEDEDDKEAWRNATITAKGAGKCVVTCKPLDGSGKSASVNVVVKRVANSFKIDGPELVVRGKSYKLKAYAFDPPESAVKKGIKWWIEGDKPAGVKLEPDTGVLTISEKAEVGESFTVIANSGTVDSEPLDIEIVKGNADKLIVQTNSTEPWFQVKTKKSGHIKNLNLFEPKADTTSENKAYNAGHSQIIVFAEGSYKGEDLGVGTTFKSSNEKVVSVTATVDGTGAVLKAVGCGKATITCTYNDSGRKKATFKVKVTKPVESIKITGQSAIALKKSATFKVKEVLPETAGNKKVTWSISGNAPGVTISKSGKVKVGNSISDNSIVTVVATAADGSGVTGTMDFIVCSEKTKSINLDAVGDDEIYDISRAKKTGKLQSARLYTVNIPKNGAEENKLNLVTDSKYALDWTSSNESVVKVEPSNGGKSAIVTAKAKGSATITCKALDGSKKKASVKITVKVPASGIQLIPQDGQTGEYHFLAYEKSVSINAVLGKSFGAASDTRIKWEYEFLQVDVDRDENGNPVSFDVDETSVDYSSLKQILKFEPVDGKLTMPSLKLINSSGRFRGDDEREEFMFAIRVTAISDYGKGYEASQVFIGCPKVESIRIYDGVDSY